jgi:hypothetical protein
MYLTFYKNYRVVFLLASWIQWRKEQDPDPDPLVRGMDPRIRIWIHNKMSWIRNTDISHLLSARSEEKKIWYYKFAVFSPTYLVHAATAVSHETTNLKEKQYIGISYVIPMLTINVPVL